MLDRLLALTLAVLAAASCEDRHARRARQEREFEQRQDEALRAGVEQMLNSQRAEEDERIAALADQIVDSIHRPAPVGEATPLGVGRKIRDEIDPANTGAELLVDLSRTPDADEWKSHADRLVTMQRLEIGELAVGYEERAGGEIRGVSYAKEFSVAWARKTEIVRLSYFTRSEVDATAFVAYLRKVVAIVERDVR